MTSKAPAKKCSGVFRFIACSIIGIVVFFVQIPIGGNSRIPVDHLIAFVKDLIKDYYAVIIAALIISSVVFGIFRKKEKSGMGIFYMAQSVVALVTIAIYITGYLPESFHGIMNTALSATGNILCAIFITSVFVPLLVDYGLVDFVGVFVKPFMRKVFKTPGSSAVIGVSAFLGNYSMGHVLSRKMYDEGQFTERESVIVSVGFSTCSIGLMINLANYMNIMPHWNLYVITILLSTFLTTVVVARIPPVSRKKDEYAPNVKAVPEGDFTRKNLLKTAFEQGTRRAADAKPLGESLFAIMKRVIPVICEITGTSMFIIVLALILLEYTNIFSMIGTLFVPILYLCGIGTEELLTVTSPLGACLFEPVLSGIVSEGIELSTSAKWIISVVPYSSVIFFAGFLPSMWKSRINCSIWEALIIWLERMAIGIVITAIFTKLMITFGIIY